MMKKMITPFLVAVSLVALGASVPSFAADTPSSTQAKPSTSGTSLEKGSRAFIENVADRGIGFLSNKSMTPSAQKSAFATLLQDSFDMDTIGRFALGPYWRTATAAQRTEYQRLFRKMIIEVYSARFASYNGQKLEIGTVKTVNETDAVVSSTIVPADGGEKVRVDWRVRQAAARFRVVDVIVEGVSMGVTQRSDFASVIGRGGGDVGVLIDHLKNPKKE